MAHAASVLLDLTRRYLEPQRRYHALGHVSDLLTLGRDLKLSDEQVMAVWFHDAIYDPRSKTNEEDSAKLAEDSLLACGWDRPRAARVARMVLDTKAHRPSSPESELVIDLDLSPLAADWERFQVNTAAIRFEYAWIPEAEFWAARRAFFAVFLERPRIYWSEWGKALEPKARANLQRVLRES